ncbi:DUF4265 domain-containing protein [Klebsiella aerogenes]|uniref:DUF4265 domain-containing protein n=1 Tax=Klebsiella aerogenes TaxID=548 RepID=UPI0022798B89|nr:DUF4265 domain-containing protein [Klebsiella aerogenes]MCY4763328.1 DUF4265 domain-containing protein [Klebsiella aerogenes]
MTKMMYNDDYLKVTFKLIRDEDGYPPVSYESIWVKKDIDGDYVLDNIPTYIYGVSKSDKISFHDENGELIVDGIKNRNGHSTLRVYVFDKANLIGIINKIRELGANTSSSSTSTYFSIDITPDISFDLIDSYLSGLLSNEILDYEDACLQHPNIDIQRKHECESLINIIM